MPNPDGTIENANLADKSVTTRLLDDDLTLDGTTTLGRLVADVAIITQITATTFTGPYQTATSGQHIKIIDAVLDRIEFYTGDSFEAIPGFVRGLRLGALDNPTRSLQISLTAPSTEGDADGTNIFVRSESQDDSTSPPRVVVAYGGGSSQTPEFHLQNSFRLMIDQLGTESAPAMGIGTSGDDGFFSPSDSLLSATIGGNEALRLSATRADFDIGTITALRLPVKTDTGDPSGGANGDIYVNVSDNTLRVFADSSWRTVFSW